MPPLHLAAPSVADDIGPRPARDADHERHRRVRTTLARELRDPVAGIQRTLQRLSLARVAPVPGHPGPASTHLVRRARHLAAELADVVDELLEVGGGTTRRSQRCIVVLAAVEEALAECRPRLHGRPTRIEVDPALMLTTHPGRLHEILTGLLTEAARQPEGAELGVRARRLAGELRFVVSGVADPPAPGFGLERLGPLADSLGGHLALGADERRGEWWLRLPQQRADDGHPAFTASDRPEPQPPAA